jgi:hypothetical protein
MCHAHNAYLAECDYGRQAIDRYRRPRKQASGRVAIHSDA